MSVPSVYSACFNMCTHVHTYMHKLHTYQFQLVAVARVHAIEFACFNN